MSRIQILGSKEREHYPDMVIAEWNGDVPPDPEMDTLLEPFRTNGFVRFVIFRWGDLMEREIESSKPPRAKGEQ